MPIRFQTRRDVGVRTRWRGAASDTFQTPWCSTGPARVQVREPPFWLVGFGAPNLRAHEQPPQGVGAGDDDCARGTRMLTEAFRLNDQKWVIQCALSRVCGGC